MGRKPGRSWHAEILAGSWRAGRSAFTLVELMVVVGIIAVLVAMTLPALSSANEQAKGVQCLSNLRQMVVAANAYAEANHGSYPIAFFNPPASPPTTVSINWDFTVETRSGVVTVKPGLLWGSDDAARVQQCPSFDGKSNTPADPYTGYNYNTSFIGHGDPDLTSPGKVVPPAMIVHVRNSTGCALFGDGEWGKGADKFMRAPFINPGDASFTFGRYAGTQGFRHHGRTNVAFADGHAEALSDLFNNSYALEKARVAKGTGFLSTDNSMYDLK